MCVVSMVMDHYHDGWRRKYIPVPMPDFVPVVPLQPYRGPTQEELDEFRRLMERAREYDKKNNEPDCENDGKKKALLEMARILGVDISFIDDPK